MTSYNYICIEGNIGVGKTTLATMLAKEWNAGLLLEEFAENSFLDKFYQNPEQYAFPLEVSFLVERFNQLQQKLPQQDLFHPLTIADYFFDKSVLFAQNTLKEDQFRLFLQLYTTFSKQLPKPDLLLYLYNQVPKLQMNIRKRARTFELTISDAYLEGIQAGYLKYFRTLELFPILVVDITDADFVSEPKDYEALKELLFQKWGNGLNVRKI